mmetsp:Transcript_70476/g.117703  ORF Transcript_70476/g.117703 Transcript_70476/m.117703 type:complete len:221 (-) Transcript_70476:1440-2102(-)
MVRVELVEVKERLKTVRWRQPKLATQIFDMCNRLLAGETRGLARQNSKPFVQHPIQIFLVPQKLSDVFSVSHHHFNLRDCQGILRKRIRNTIECPYAGGTELLHRQQPPSLGFQLVGNVCVQSAGALRCLWRRDPKDLNDVKDNFCHGLLLHQPTALLVKLLELGLHDRSAEVLIDHKRFDLGPVDDLLPLRRSDVIELDGLGHPVVQHLLFCAHDGTCS